MADIVEQEPTTSIKRNADDAEVGEEAKRAKSEDREVNVDPIHDTAFGLCLQARTFLVGPKAEPFVIHRNLLRQRCGTYWQLLLDAAKEDPSLMKQSSHLLEDEDPRTFSMFVAWLYTGEIPPSSEDEEDWDIPHQPRLVPGKTDEYERWFDEDLVDLWVFAATNQIYELSNAAVSCLAMQNDKYNRTTTKAALVRAFEYTGSTTHLQMYLIDEAVFRLGSAKVPKNTSKYPVQYVSRILEEIMSKHTSKQKVCHRKEVKKPRWQSKPCYYHTHLASDGNHAAKRECKQFWLSSPIPRYHEEIYDLFDDTVTLVVGPSKIPFVIHKGLLCKFSPFFKNLFQRNVAEANTGRYELETDNVRDFILFLYWLYEEKVQSPSPKDNALIEKYLSAQDRSMTLWEAPTSSDDSGFESLGDADAEHEIEEIPSSATTVIADVPPPTQDLLPLPVEEEEPIIDDATRMSQIQSDLISLFIFAEHRNIPQLRNDIMNRIIDLRSKRWPLLTTNPATIRKCYTSLPEESDLCSYLEQEAAFCWTFAEHEALLDNATELPPTFLGNVLREIFQERLDVEEERRPSWCGDLCFFHEHANEEEEKECKRELRKWQEELEGSDYAAVDSPELEW